MLSSLAQLAVSDTTGLGASGVVYGFFGLMWGARKHVPIFGQDVARFGYALWIWLPVGYLLTRLDMLNLGNAAHAGGLVVGVLAAQEIFVRKNLRLWRTAAVLVVAAALVPLFWAPWSADWVAYRAMKAHEAGRYDEALAGYTKAMRMGGDRMWGLQNIALACLAKGDVAGYESVLAQLRRLDPDAADKVAALASAADGATASGRPPAP